MSCVNVLDNDSTLVNPPTYGQSFRCAFRGSNHDAASTSRIRFNTDGSWTVTRSTGGGGASLGSWHVGAPANPGAFEIRFTGNVQEIKNTSGNQDCFTPPVEETNDPVDTGWLSLAVAQEQSVSTFASANVNCNAQDSEAIYEFVIQIRQISNQANAVSTNGSICAGASALTL